MTNDTSNISGVTELNCEECSKDIPYAAESEDYVAHFCGLSCYAEWKEKHSSSAQNTFVHGEKVAERTIHLRRSCVR